MDDSMTLLEIQRSACPDCLPKVWCGQAVGIGGPVPTFGIIHHHECIWFAKRSLEHDGAHDIILATETAITIHTRR